MKTRALSSVLLSTAAAAVALCGQVNASGLPPKATPLAAGNNAFACDLYGQLKSTEGNLFYSPFSVSSALGMTSAGARGTTEEQMRKTLRFPMAGEALHASFAELFTQFKAVQKSGDVKLEIANSIWPRIGLPLREDFLKTLKTYYESEVTPLDYGNHEPLARATINQWVEGKTAKKITELLKKPLPGNVALVLVNAVYFKGAWAVEFSPKLTREAPFFVHGAEAVQVPMMARTGDYRYAETKEAQLLELPFKGNEVSMLVILPHSKDASALAKLEAGLNAATLDQWRDWLRESPVQVFMPKFKVTWGTESLKQQLEALGMVLPFGRADFSGINGGHDLYIDDVLHKAFVEVNEEGAEAAAATAVIMGTRGGPPPEPPVFRADHPFLFLIQEKSSGSILFMGRLSKPNHAE